MKIIFVYRYIQVALNNTQSSSCRDRPSARIYAKKKMIVGMQLRKTTTAAVPSAENAISFFVIHESFVFFSFFF